MKAPLTNAVAEVLTDFRVFRKSIPLGLLLMVFLVSSCHEKTNGQNSNANSAKSPAGKVDDDKTKPKVTVKVNRRYDEKGNLIGFDSLYSSFYSNVEGDTAGMDSLFASFDRHFNAAGNSLMTDRLNSLFFQDSIMYPDFFHDDFFMKRYELNDAYMRNMMTQMDSLKNRFYEQKSRRRKVPEQPNP